MRAALSSHEYKYILKKENEKPKLYKIQMSSKIEK